MTTRHPLYGFRKRLEKAMPTFFGKRKPSEIWVEMKALEDIMLPRGPMHIEAHGHASMASTSESTFWTSFEPI